MPEANPNRVKSGKRGAGRYDFKVNSEASIDLVDEEPQESPKQRYEDLLHRAKEADFASREVMRKNPTFESYREQFEEHAAIITEALKYDSRTYGDDLVIPVKEFRHMIDVRLKSENPRPNDVGRIKVNIFSKGEQRSIEVHAETKPWEETDLGQLYEQVTSKLSLNRDESRVLDSTRKMMADDGAACWSEFRLNKEKTGTDMIYAEIVYLPSLRSEFIEEHGGYAPVADGWL